MERKNRTITQVLRLILSYSHTVSQPLLSELQLILDSRPISTRPASRPLPLPSAISPISSPPTPFGLRHFRPSYPSRPSSLSAAALPAVDEADSSSAALDVYDWLSYVQSHTALTSAAA